MSAPAWLEALASWAGAALLALVGALVGAMWALMALLLLLMAMSPYLLAGLALVLVRHLLVRA